MTELHEAEEAVLQSRKMDAVGSLTAGVAHDFNNLLAIVVGNAELLRMHASDADTAMLDDIISAGLHGADLTRRLLAFSRQQPIRPRVTNINALLIDTAELLRRTLCKTISVNLNLLDDDLQCHVDPLLLQNALLYVALNSRDAMPDGGTLTIESQLQVVAGDTSDDDAESVVIVLSDDGIGMSPNVRDRALDPFYTTKDGATSNGMGLPMVYGFVKQSNGELAIDSEQNVGTTVSIFLERCFDN